jgi:hypothetical protein
LLVQQASRAKTEIISFQMNFGHAYLKFDSELSICAAKNKHRFHIKEVNFILYFSLKNNIVLDDIFVHIALIYLMVFSNHIIHHCQ